MNRNNMIHENQSSTAQSGGRKLRNDIIFIGALLLILLCTGLGFYFLRPQGDTVIVKVNGEVYATYDLSQDMEVDIYTGEEGTQYNKLVIRDGKAYVESASCPDGICAGHMPISKDGQSIFCKPHGIVIVVQKSDNQDQPDIIV